jgi:hypothetical protein
MANPEPEWLGEADGSTQRLHTFPISQARKKGSKTSYYTATKASGTVNSSVRARVAWFRSKVRKREAGIRGYYHRPALL